jgi:hypothetical protein
MKEEIIIFGNNDSLAGVITYTGENQSEKDFGVIFLNAGLIHKIGPNRLYVKIARILAGKGINCFRFDYSGLGDSAISNEKKNQDEIKNGEIDQAINKLTEKISIKKFILIGICSGAEDAFKASLNDPRVVGLLLIDGTYYDKMLLNDLYATAAKKTAMRYYKKNIFSVKRWLKIISGKSNIFSRNNIFILQGLINRGKKKTNSEKPGVFVTTDEKVGIEEWEKLFKRNVKIYLIFCEGGTYIDLFKLTISGQLEAINRNGQLKIELIKDVDHTFTPVWSQELLTEKISNWIDVIQTDNT